MSQSDWLQFTATLIAIIGGLIAAAQGINELRQGRVTQQRELRWRQAEMAKKLLDELYANTPARSAMKMLDWDGRVFDAGGRLTAPVTTAFVKQALRISDLQFNADEAFVRDCFEALFDALDNVEHYIGIDLIQFEDVRAPIGYYVRLMAMNKPVFAAFMQQYGYERSLRLCARFEEWAQRP